MSSDRAKAYTQAGVDIEAGNDLVSRIKGMVERNNKYSLSGGFLYAF